MNNKTGLASIIISLIVALIIGAGLIGYDSLKKKRSVPNVVPSTSIPTTIISPTIPTPTTTISTPSTTENPILYKTSWDDKALIGSLYISKDGGKSWKLIHKQYKGQVVYDYDKNNPQIIYYADSGFNTMAEDGGIGVYKSMDGGEHIENIAKGIKTRIRQEVGVLESCGFIKIDPINSNVVDIYIDGEFWQSKDGGHTWAKYIPNISDCNICQGVYLQNTQSACDKDRCIADVAIARNDSSICNQIQAKNLKSYCQQETETK